MIQIHHFLHPHIRQLLQNPYYIIAIISFQSAYMMTEDDLDNEPEDQSGGRGGGGGVPDFPTPLAREYILRTTAKRPAPWSRQSMQRMYCTLVKDEFRLSGAFTSDTTFQ